jgi:hypothetical protein
LEQYPERLLQEGKEVAVACDLSHVGTIDSSPSQEKKHPSSTSVEYKSSDSPRVLHILDPS